MPRSERATPKVYLLVGLDGEVLGTYSAMKRAIAAQNQAMDRSPGRALRIITFTLDPKEPEEYGSQLR